MTHPRTRTTRLTGKRKAALARALAKVYKGVALTALEAEAYADDDAQRILCLPDRHAAFQKLDAGELRGTLAHDIFAGHRWVLEGK